MAKDRNKSLDANNNPYERPSHGVHYTNARRRWLKNEATAKRAAEKRSGEKI